MAMAKVEIRQSTVMTDKGEWKIELFIGENPAPQRVEYADTGSSAYDKARSIVNKYGGARVIWIDKLN